MHAAYRWRRRRRGRLPGPGRCFGRRRCAEHAVRGAHNSRPCACRGSAAHPHAAGRASDFLRAARRSFSFACSLNSAGADETNKIINKSKTDKIYRQRLCFVRRINFLVFLLLFLVSRGPELRSPSLRRTSDRHNATVRHDATMAKAVVLQYLTGEAFCISRNLNFRLVAPSFPLTTPSHWIILPCNIVNVLFTG